MFQSILNHIIVMDVFCYGHGISIFMKLKMCFVKDQLLIFMDIFC